MKTKKSLKVLFTSLVVAFSFSETVSAAVTIVHEATGTRISAPDTVVLQGNIMTISQINNASIAVNFHQTSMSGYSPNELRKLILDNTNRENDSIIILVPSDGGALRITFEKIKK